jgi:hypothetical protein
MIVSDKLTYLELKAMVIEGLKDPSYNQIGFTIDPGYATKVLFDIITQGGFVRVIRDPITKNIVSCMVARIGNPFPYVKEKALIAVNIYTFVKGRKAVRALQLLHDEMIDEARRRKLNYCCSSSALPNYQTFNRILREDGWKDLGGGMVFHLH